VVDPPTVKTSTWPSSIRTGTALEGSVRSAQEAMDIGIERGQARRGVMIVEIAPRVVGDGSCPLATLRSRDLRLPATGGNGHPGLRHQRVQAS